MGPCQHGMARSQVADGMTVSSKRVAANILKEQSQTADDGQIRLDVALSFAAVTPILQVLMELDLAVYKLARTLDVKAQDALVSCTGFGDPGFVRMSYAASMDDITRGMDRIEKFLAQ